MSNSAESHASDVSLNRRMFDNWRQTRWISQWIPRDLCSLENIWSDFIKIEIFERNKTFLIKGLKELKFITLIFSIRIKIKRFRPVFTCSKISINYKTSYFFCLILRAFWGIMEINFLLTCNICMIKDVISY